MDWNALVIGLLGGLVGGLLGAAAGLASVLLRAEADIDQEVREARRAHRQRQAVHIEAFLEEVIKYHGATFLRGSIENTRTRARGLINELGITVTDD